MKYLNKLQVFGYLSYNFDRTVWLTASKFSKGGSQQLQTGSELTHSFVAVSDSIYTTLANQHPSNWSTQLTMHCSNASYTKNVLYPLLPDFNTTGYCLRQRRHHRILPSKTGCMQSNNFLTRLLYKNLHWHITYSAVSYSPIRTDYILSYIVIYFVFCTFFWDISSKVRFAIF